MGVFHALKQKREAYGIVLTRVSPLASSVYRRLTRLPHKRTTMEELQDPAHMYCRADQVRRDTRIQSILLQHSATRWKHEYLTSLSEFYHSIGRGDQQVKIGDIVLVHDDGPRMNWKMAVVESLATGKDGLVHSANVRTSRGLTNRPLVKLFPLEVNVCDDRVVGVESNKGEQEDHNTTEAEKSLDNPMTEECPRRSAAQRARKRLAEWVQIICAVQRMRGVIEQCHM